MRSGAVRQGLDTPRPGLDGCAVLAGDQIIWVPAGGDDHVMVVDAAVYTDPKFLDTLSASSGGSVPPAAPAQNGNGASGGVGNNGNVGEGHGIPVKLPEESGFSEGGFAHEDLDAMSGAVEGAPDAGGVLEDAGGTRGTSVVSNSLVV